MNTWEDFDCEAKLVEETTKKQEPDCVQLLHDAIGLFADALSIGSISDSTDVSCVKKSLLSQNFATLKCAVDLATRGYYTQSMSLLRNVYENWVSFHYLTQCPNEAHLWLNRNEQPPWHSKMLEKLGAFNPYKDVLKKWYGVFCCFAHPNAAAILPLISTSFALNETTIHYGTTYENNLFKSVALVTSSWTGAMLTDVGQHVLKTNEWHNKQIAAIEEIIKFTEKEIQNPKSDAKQTLRDA